MGVMTKGMFQVGENVTLSVCAHNRALTCKNHSATHLLQKALRKVLGDHVEQAGSYVDAGRLRFDFTHFSAMTPDEIKKVEELVNQEIQASLPVVTQVMTLEEAKKTGAMALFGEKYGDKVRVVRWEISPRSSAAAPMCRIQAPLHILRLFPRLVLPPV